MKKLLNLFLLFIGFTLVGCAQIPTDPNIKPEIEPEVEPEIEPEVKPEPNEKEEFKILDLEYTGPRLDEKWFYLENYCVEGVDHNGDFEYQGTGFAFEVELIVAVDGDTAHFDLPDELELYQNTSFRFLNMDTEETMREQEEWGKPASNYTKDRLENAYSIVLQNDPNEGIYDIYQRGLAWIWVKDTANSDYELLNYSIIQQGLATPAYLWGAGETIYYNDVCYTDWILEAYDEAQNNERGFHGNFYDPYWDYVNNCPNDKWNTYILKEEYYI